MTEFDCLDPILGERVLDGARPASGPPSPEHLAHLAACNQCRTSIERTRRVARIWRSLEPSAEEVSAFQIALAARATQRPQARGTLHAVLAATVLFAAVASAAVGFVANVGRSTALARARPPVTIAAPHPKASSSGPSTRPSEEDAVPVDELPLATPSLAPTRPATRRPSPSKNADGRSAAPGAWTDAASAMRDGDYDRAERAFDVLANAPDAATRDSARLARAQLWLAEGRRLEARHALENLANSAGTVFVRERAAAALENER
jgi:hypothetical protein